VHKKECEELRDGQAAQLMRSFVAVDGSNIAAVEKMLAGM
jgi:hypothetical protein